MKRSIYIVIIAIAMLTGCKGKSGGGDQSTPEGVAGMIFSAAKSGNYGPLKDICNPSLEPDSDSKMICEVPTGDSELKSKFKEYFSTGKVVGSPVIEGDKAKVSVTLGKDGTKEETFNMAKKDGKWYLVSF
jgi:hypothetical protein